MSNNSAARRFYLTLLRKQTSANSEHSDVKDWGNLCFKDVLK